MRLLITCLLVLCGSLSASYLTPQEIDKYYQQGYFIKKGAISAYELGKMDIETNALYEKVVKELENEKYPCLDSNQATYIEGTQIVFIKHKKEKITIKRMVGCGSIEPEFQKILRSEKMVHTFFSLLGVNQIEQLICQFHPKMPGDGVFFVKHRDLDNRILFDSQWEDVGGNGSYAVCIIAIDPMTNENGGIIIDEKSFPPGRSNESKITALRMEPGDMLFMHPEILHWSEANWTKKSRRVLLAGYCIYGANHRNYPGDCTNDVITKVHEKIRIRPASWKKEGDTNF